MSARRRGPTPKRTWQPMRPATAVFKGTPEQQARLDALRAIAGNRITEPEVWANDRYVAEARRDETGTVRHISFHRRDRKALRDWRETQRIKDDIAGPEAEAVELFPAQSRLVDTSNQYHLWLAPAGERWPIGFEERLLADADEAALYGAVQRPHDENWVAAGHIPTGGE